MGWYIFSGFNCKGVSGAPPFDWKHGDGAGNFTDVLGGLARRGFSQFMIYDLDKIVCGKNASETLVPMMDLFAAVGAKVLLDLRAPFQEVIQADQGPGECSDRLFALAVLYTLDLVLRWLRGASLWSRSDVQQLRAVGQAVRYGDVSAGPRRASGLLHVR